MAEYWNVKYISGIPNLPKPMDVTLNVNENAITLSKGKKTLATLEYNFILQVEARSEWETTPAKEVDKSVLARAIWGGLLLGPVGSVIGGMSGIGKRTVREEENIENWFILIYFEDSGIQSIATFLADAFWFKEKLARKVANDILTNWRNFNCSHAEFIT